MSCQLSEKVMPHKKNTTKWHSCSFVSWEKQNIYKPGIPQKLYLVLAVKARAHYDSVFVSEAFKLVQKSFKTCKELIFPCMPQRSSSKQLLKDACSRTWPEVWHPGWQGSGIAGHRPPCLSHTTDFRSVLKWIKHPVYKDANFWSSCLGNVLP